jgi:YesN/AraC family two-component response regulator
MISEKIVVIDDDLRVIKSIQIGLTEHEIIPFQDPRKGLEFLKKPNMINIVLLDVMMRETDGLTVLQEIKAAYPHIIVIMMTAFGTKDIIIQSLRYHADDFLEKPFNPTELKEMIDTHLREKSHREGSRDSFGNKIERIKDFIDRNYKNVSLETIAQELCLSSKYVSRVFSSGNAVSYRGYKVKVKMDRAKGLLTTTSKNICEIAYELGYQNPESFMRLFKRTTLLTPMAYREKYFLRKDKKQKSSAVSQKER